MGSLSTRERLLDAAIERFAADGPIATTLEDVREAAGVSVGAVYHHFPDKEALFEAARARALAEFQAEFIAALEDADDAETGIRNAVRLQFRWCSRNPAAARLLLTGRPAAAAELNREFFARVRRWWRTHARYGAVRDRDPAVIHALWLGPATDLIRHWLAGELKAPSDEDVEILAEAAWTTLKEER